MVSLPRIVLYQRISELERELYTDAQRELCTFFVPTSRDRKILQDFLLPKSTAGDSSPIIWRWEDLTRHLEILLAASCEGLRFRRQIDPPDHWLIVRYILHGFLDGHPEKEQLPPGIRQPGFISTLGDQFRELLREAISPEILGRSLGCGACQKNNCTKTAAPEGILCRLFHLYVEYLETWHLMDSAQVPLIALELLQKGEPSLLQWIRSRRFIFVGFLSFSSSQMALLSYMSSIGVSITLYSPNTGIDDFYTTVDQFPSALVEGTRSSGPFKALRIVAGSPRMEMETLARELVLWKNKKGYLSGQEILPAETPWQNIGMVFDAPLLPLAEEVLQRYRIPYSINEGLTVGQTALWDIARRIWNAGEHGWPLGETWDILREPCLAGREIATSPPADIFTLNEKGWIGFLEHAAPERGLDSFKKMCLFVKTIKKGGTPVEILSALYSLAAENPSWGKELSLWAMDHPEFDESIRRLQAALRETEHKVESLGELQDRIGPAGQVRFSGSEAVSFLHHWTSMATIWLPPAIKGALSLFIGTPPVLEKNSLWIMPNITASIWPGKMSESSLLPDRHKLALHDLTGTERGHLPLLKEKRDQREALFRRLVACGEDLLILSSPSTDALGKPLPPSPFLGKGVSENWISFPDDMAPLERSLSHLLPQNEETMVQHVEIGEDASPYGGILRELPTFRGDAPEPLKGHLSALDDYESCPFRFVNLNVLKIEEPAEPGLDVRKCGSTLHLLWERVWQAYEQTSRPLSLLARQYWEETLEESYPELLRVPQLARHKELLLQQVTGLADLQQSMENNGLAGLRLKQFRELDLPILIVDGVSFTGKADRIEYLHDGRILIFDYKLGKSNGRNKSLQLAAYALALLEGKGKKTHLPVTGVSGGLYLCHGDTSVAGAIEGKDLQNITGGKNGRSNNALETLFLEAQGALERMAASLKTGVFPPSYGSETCRHCSLNLMCRKSELGGRGENDGNDENE